ncbi:Carboxylesterase family protein [Cryptosporidium felis]|nr:Carboxylesterase family protein [Cryptosporidium felis]
MYKFQFIKILASLSTLFLLKIKLLESIEIEGIQLIGKKNNGITSFYNIRYGVANRFQPPKLLRVSEAAIMDEEKVSKIPKSYDLSINKGSSCPQDCSDIQQTSQKTFLCRGTEPETQSEACLTLNVFTQTTQLEEIINQFSNMAKHVSPNNTQINMLSNVNSTLVNSLNKQKTSIASLMQTNMVQLKPVYVFIHGGLYLFGSSNTETNIGEKLAESGAIIVTINYRIGILGWLRAKNLSVGNMGFLDQRLALEWVNKYIEYFGGDPSRVILAGHSAGAKAVLCHSVTSESNKYFSSVIIHSGALSQNETTLKEAESMGEMAENLASERCLATILSCTTKQLLEIQKEVRSQIVKSNPSKALHSWSPIVDGIIIKDSCRNLAFSGSIPSEMKVIISTTSSEGIQFFRSFIAYLPAISRGLATSNFAFRYLISRVFGPKAGDAMKIYSTSNFQSSVSATSELEDPAIYYADQSSQINSTVNKSLDLNEPQKNQSSKPSDFISNNKGEKEGNQFVSSTGFNLLQVGRSREEEKWSGILDDIVAFAYARMIGDFIYSCPARMFIQKISQYNPNVYGYYINSGFRWAETLKRGYDTNTGSSIISEIFQSQKFSLRNSQKGIVCQSDDVACKTFVFDCSDKRLVCHMEDMIWLFQTSPQKLNDGSDKAFNSEQNLASKFFTQIIKKLNMEHDLSIKNQQLLKMSLSAQIDYTTSEIFHWSPYSEGAGRILQFDGINAQLVSDFKKEECTLWEWRSPDLSLNFHQLVDSKTIPQTRSNIDNGFTGTDDDENDSENRNLSGNFAELQQEEGLSLDQDKLDKISVFNQNKTDILELKENEEF